MRMGIGEVRMGMMRMGIGENGCGCMSISIGFSEYQYPHV
jgi:hypothetical protein